MRVLKRDNTYEDVSLDKVQKRIDKQCEGLNVVSIEIAQKVCSRIHDGVKTSTLDDEAARLCAQLITKHPDYGVVASRIAVSNHHKKTSPSFSETVNMLYNATDVHGKHNPLVSKELFDIVQVHKDKLNSIINYERDYNYDYFGFKTLERSYLLKVKDRIVERPQHMIMRVALGIHGWDIKEAIETYELMSTRYFTHATPTLFNAGTPRAQMSSCYLLHTGDSITGMYKTLADCAQISKYAGGIGIHIHDIRPTDSYIRGTNGKSTGIIPMLRVYNAAARHVNQCFAPDTHIYTQKGFKPIAEIDVGDLVYTIDGSLKPVLGVSINPINKTILSIKNEWTHAENGVYVTKEHQIFTLVDDEIIEVSADKLQIGDYVGYPNTLDFGVYNKTAFTYDNIYWVKITEIREVEYQGLVYDLNIKDNHNYVTDMGIVHNSGKRNGSIAVYLEPWHADIEKFLDIRKNSGNHEERCHDLFSAMWIPDLFMKRVDANADWSLMCPDECPGLTTAYGEEFEKLYEEYEAKGKYRKQVKAQTLFYSIMRSQIETGTPYMLYKDAVNRKNNQKNIGTIKSSNLCVAPETMILTDKGYVNIAESVDKQVKVWNGDQFSEVTVKKTGENQKLITVVFSNGVTLRCTPYHKFYIESGSVLSNESNVVQYEAKDLKPNMKLRLYNLPVLNIPDTGAIIDKTVVPVNESIETKVKWLEEFVDANGRLVESEFNDRLVLDGPDEEFAMDIFYMLQTMSIHPKVYLNQIVIEAEGIIDLKTLGFSPKNVNIVKYNEVSYIINPYIYIVGIEDDDEYDDTYCFNEPLKHMGIFNGILTGNCTEIVEYSDENESAVCNLASIGLPTFVKYSEDGKPYFDFKQLHNITQVVTRNLNKVIDRTFYPVPETKRSNLRHRPIGLGVQGLANAFILMRMPFESAEACDLNRKIFATIYHAALTASMLIAKKRYEYREEFKTADTERKEYIIKYLNMIPDEEAIEGQYSGSYSTYIGSPAWAGNLQYDLWGVTEPETVDGLLDWKDLKEQIQQYGLRNSLLLAPMPTATTSQILGFNESIEAITSNIFQRQTLAGEFTIINKHLIEDLLKIGLWNTDMKDKILTAGGSIQNIPEIPAEIKILYKTVWEIKQKIVIDQSADRGPYVCQSQSLNIYLEDPDFTKLTNVHFYGWKKGLKTGMYYLRSRPRAKMTAYTIDPPKQVAEKPSEEEIMACRRDNPEGCLMCSG